MAEEIKTPLIFNDACNLAEQAMHGSVGVLEHRVADLLMRVDVASREQTEQGVQARLALLDELAEALDGLVSAAAAEGNEKGCGGYLFARLSAARTVLAKVLR